MRKLALKKVKRSAFIVLICSIILIGQGALIGLVLCFGTDGHVDIKMKQYRAQGASLSPLPFLPQRGQDKNIQKTPNDEHGCGPCLDIPIFTIGQSDTQNMTLTKTQNPGKTFSVAIASPQRITSDTLLTLSDSLQPLASTPAQPLLQTVVLQI